MKDKMVQQDKLLKLQNKSIRDLTADISSHIDSFEVTLSQQSALIMKKFQEENQYFQQQQKKRQNLGNKHGLAIFFKLNF